MRLGLSILWAIFAVWISAGVQWHAAIAHGVHHYAPADDASAPMPAVHDRDHAHEHPHQHGEHGAHRRHAQDHNHDHAHGHDSSPHPHGNVHDNSPRCCYQSPPPDHHHHSGSHTHVVEAYRSSQNHRELAWPTLDVIAARHVEIPDRAEDTPTVSAPPPPSDFRPREFARLRAPPHA